MSLKEAGIELTPEQIQALKEVDREQFEQGLSELDERLTMGCWAHFPVRSTVTTPGLPSSFCVWD